MESLLEHLRSLPFYKDQICHVEKISGRAAKYDVLETPLHPLLSHAFHKFMHPDMENHDTTLRLYSHQVISINALRNGKHVIVSTPTASGKIMK